MGIFLSVVQTIYTFSPEIAIGAAWRTFRIGLTEPSICDVCACNEEYAIRIAAIAGITTTYPQITWKGIYQEISFKNASAKILKNST